MTFHFLLNWKKNEKKEKKMTFHFYIKFIKMRKKWEK
jgi:hypothetical protein